MDRGPWHPVDARCRSVAPARTAHASRWAPRRALGYHGQGRSLDARGGEMATRLGRATVLLLALLLALALPGGGDAARAQGDAAQPSLLLYNTVASLLAGDLLN